MTAQEQYYKEKIADKYVQNLKDELNIFEKIMIVPISKKIKEILKSNKEIHVDSLNDLEDLGFWRKVLGVKIGDKVLFEKLTNKIFDFIKEKQKSIIDAETSGTLSELFEEVITGQLDNLDQQVSSITDNQDTTDTSDDGSVNPNDGDDSLDENTSNNDENTSDGDEDVPNNNESTSHEDEDVPNNDENTSDEDEDVPNNDESTSDEDEGTPNNDENASDEDETTSDDENTSNEDENPISEDPSAQVENNDDEPGEDGNSQNDNPEKENETNPKVVGAATGVGGATAVYGGISATEHLLGIDRMAESAKEFDVERTKSMMQKISTKMSEKLNSGVKMNRVQKKVYTKSINEFNKAIGELKGEGGELFKQWQNLSDKIPFKFLQESKIDPRILRQIDNLPEPELAKLIGKDEKYIAKYFKSKGINASHDLIGIIKGMKNAQEIKAVTRILRNSTRLSKIMRGIKGMGVATFLFMGLDVWCYLNSKKEAELESKINELRGEILKDQAEFQLWVIGVGSVLLEAAAVALVYIAGGSTAGPIGTVIGIAVGVLAATGSILYDNLYADKKLFYAQNRYNFINQQRITIKQSIVQLFVSDNLDMNSRMKESIKDDRGPNSEIDTMEDAWEALIYQEEIMDGGYYRLPRYYACGDSSEENFCKNLTDDQKKCFESEKKQMEQIIETRKEYIKKYLDKNSPLYAELQQAINSNKPTEFVEQILADSKVYAYLKSDDEDAYVTNYKELDVESYKQAYKDKLSKEYAREFEIFERLRQENPTLLGEICQGTRMSRSSIEDEMERNQELDYDDDTEFTDDDYREYVQGGHYSEEEISTLKKNIDFVLKYDEYLHIGTPIEKYIKLYSSDTSLDFEYIEHVLLDLESIEKRPVWDEESSLRYLSNIEFDEKMQSLEYGTSDDVFQNIIYSIAREIGGYTGANNLLDLIIFYSGDANNTFIYYDKCWKINIDWEEDRSLGGIELSKLTKDELKKKMFGGEVVGCSYWGGRSEYSNSGELDSPIEAADNQLNAEFRRRVEEIIDREYAYIENKGNYEQEIVDFIKKNNTGQDGYVEIPEYLALNAKKAGIGDVYKFLFRVDGNQIYALSRGDTSNTTLNFENNEIKIKYETTNKFRNEYEQPEKTLIEKVDQIAEKLKMLRGKQGNFWVISQQEDELDIPVELEREISKKYIEWDNVKDAVLYMQPGSAQDYLKGKAEEYYEFFYGMYLGMLNTVTNMSCGNDMDNVGYFRGSMQFIGQDITYIENGTVKIYDCVNESIRKYLPDLLDLYIDTDTHKTIKQLLMDDNEENQLKGQSLAKQVYELCLEQAVLKFDSAGNVSDISTGDFDKKDLEKVKAKMQEDGFGGKTFHEIQNEYNDIIDFTPAFSKREITITEEESHREIDIMTQNIIETMNNVDRAYKRGEPKFIFEEETGDGKLIGKFSSRGYEQKITITMDTQKKIKSINVYGIDTTFNNPQEGFRVANLINRIKNNIKENPKGNSVPNRIMGTYGYYQWSSGGDLERDVVNSTLDIDIVVNSTIDKYYPSIKKSNQFLNYINQFM